MFGIDFANDLTTGDSLSAVAWTLAVASGSPGTDANASNRLDGLPNIVGTIAIQRLTGLQPNVKYVLSGTATTTLGNRINLYSNVLCVPVA